MLESGKELPGLAGAWEGAEPPFSTVIEDV
jgi:hypothetical protein